MAQMIDGFDQTKLWRARCRICARRWLAEQYGATDSDADAVIAELLSRADQVPVAATDAAQMEDYFGRVLVSCVDLVWRKQHPDDEEKQTVSTPK
jgi:hypothetical protein